MANTVGAHDAPTAPQQVTSAMMRGTDRRWKRGMEPVPAGGSLKSDGTPDYGLFGPGSMVWEVLLHPSTVVFHHIGQSLAQDTYMPIVAGIRDHEPIVKKALEGTLTAFDGYERASRGAGIHGIMWLGDTATATSMADFLRKVHGKVKGDVIDISHPELGGYAAAEPRELMWAALTELHPMLRMYEAFAFRGGKKPHRLTDEQRDQFIREAGAYLRIHHAPENEIPTNMAELKALYAKYDDLFGHSDTIGINPERGYHYVKVLGESIVKNLGPSQKRAIRITTLVYQTPKKAAVGAFAPKARRALGVSPEQDAAALAETSRFLRRAWWMQQWPTERYILRAMWGPYGVKFFKNARKLHKQALKRRAKSA